MPPARLFVCLLFGWSWFPVGQTPVFAGSTVVDLRVLLINTLEHFNSDFLDERNPTKNYNAALSCIAAGVGQPTRRSLRCQSNALPRKRKKLHRNHCTCQCLALASKLWLLYKIKRRRAFVPDSILLTRCGLLACTHPLFLLEHEQWRCARRCVVHAPCCWTAMALLQHFRQVDGCFKWLSILGDTHHPS